ncbi:hypothetical protein GCM10010449_18880 [Streptomyces rectiviolaceus]|uniref:Uncharacterized protein n=1 Tax=Streptomyces rectiviolaceus TaxID=332591 RepID=A0ABP6MAX4_9ACTN
MPSVRGAASGAADAAGRVPAVTAATSAAAARAARRLVLCMVKSPVFSRRSVQMLRGARNVCDARDAVTVAVLPELSARR